MNAATINFASLFSAGVAAATTHHRSGRAANNVPRDLLKTIVLQAAEAAREQNGAAPGTLVTLSRASLINELLANDPNMADNTASGLVRELVNDQSAWLTENRIAILMDTRRSGTRAETKITVQNKEDIAAVLRQMVDNGDELKMPEVIAACGRAGIAVSAVRTHAATVAQSLGFTIAEGRRGGKAVHPLKAGAADALARHLKSTGATTKTINFAQVGVLLADAFTKAQQQNGAAGAAVEVWKSTAAAQYFKAHYSKFLDGGADDVTDSGTDDVDSVDDDGTAADVDSVDTVEDEDAPNPYN